MTAFLSHDLTPAVVNPNTGNLCLVSDIKLRAGTQVFFSSGHIGWGAKVPGQYIEVLVRTSMSGSRVSGRLQQMLWVPRCYMNADETQNLTE